MRYWIGLGSNLGDRLNTLKTAVAAIDAVMPVVERSRVYAASPVGGPPQPSFLNAVIVIETPMLPLEVLHALQTIETAHGRAREDEVRWGPRTLDLDILMMGARGECVVDLPSLTVPHARLAERWFALAPLTELGPTLVHPQLGRPLTSLLASAQSSGGGDIAAPTGDRL